MYIRSVCFHCYVVFSLCLDWSQDIDGTLGRRAAVSVAIKRRTVLYREEKQIAETEAIIQDVATYYRNFTDGSNREDTDLAALVLPSDCGLKGGERRGRSHKRIKPTTFLSGHSGLYLKSRLGSYYG